jgi:hypothetical protein
MTKEEKYFYKERNRKYVQRYAPDISSLQGLFIIFELYKMPNQFQISYLKELRKGNYNRATAKELENRNKNKNIGIGL